VAVLPFHPLDDSHKDQGRYLAEKLTTYLAQTGKVKVVERALLEDLQTEHHLAQSGALNPDQLARLGRMLQAQAVVIGSFVSIGSTIELNARLIHLESGIILAAGRKRIKGRLRIPPSDKIEGVIEFQWGTPEAPRKTFTPAPAQQQVDCRSSDERINSLIGSIVELKARYWANEVRRAKLPRSALYKPVQAIPDPALKVRFYNLVEIAAHNKSNPLTETEMKRFQKADREAFILNLQCAHSYSPFPGPKH